MKNIIKYLLIAILFPLYCEGQQAKIDSIKLVLKSSRDDTSRVNLLNQLGWEVKEQNPEEARTYGQQALQLAEKLQWEKGIANASHTIGESYRLVGDFTNALKYFQKALDIRVKTNDKVSIAKTLGNIGIIYGQLSDLPKALDYTLRALKLDEEVGNKNGVTRHLITCGNIYQSLQDYPKSLDYQLRALKIIKELDNKGYLAPVLSNIGNIYMELSDYPKALDYQLQALSALEGFENKAYSASILGNIGNLYLHDADYPKALDYSLKALRACEEVEDKLGMATALSNLGAIYLNTNKLQEAEHSCNQALRLTKENGFLEVERNVILNLSEIYTKQGKYNRALEQYKQYVVLRDSIENQEKQKEITRKEMTYEFEKKEAVATAEHKKELESQEAIAEEKSRKQKVITWSVIGGLFLLLFFSGYVWRSLRASRKQNQIIEFQKKEVEHQKELVEAHQKDIIDSIMYAKRLQTAILPPPDYFKQNQLDSFVLFRPKDILSGDFYWVEVIDGIIFIASADCTGHGVPASMLTVVCHNALNRTVKEFGLRETGKILDKVTELVLETFERSSEDVKDGMDISLLAINKTTKQIQWSGANNPLWYIQNGAMVDITANKQPIGKHDNRKPFTTHDIPYQPDTIFYLFTDGYADSFGGVKGKKFKYKQLEEKLLEMHHKPLAEQKDLLDKIYVDWVGDLEQVDDVCIIGIRV